MHLLSLLGILLSSNEWILSEDTSKGGKPVEPLESQTREACAGHIRSLEDYARIINGIPVEEGEFPFLVSISAHRATLAHSCGGSIITKLHVLSAAHCFTGPILKASYYKVVAGTRDFGGFFGKSENEQSRWGEAVYMHPEFSYVDNTKFYLEPGERNELRGKLLYDLAILEVEFPFEFGKYVAAKPLHHFQGVGWLDGLAESDKFQCTTAGWGKTSPDYAGGYPQPPFVRTPAGVYSIVSLKTNQTLLPMTKCKEMVRRHEYDPATQQMFKNLFNRTGHICGHSLCNDACQGDSGGPFMCYFEKNKPPTLVGMVSFGIGCGGMDNPAIYARLDAAEPWIRTMVGNTILGNNGVKLSVQVGFPILATLLTSILGSRSLEYINILF